MEVSALIMCINHPRRIRWMKQTLQSIQKTEFDFEKKLLHFALRDSDIVDLGTCDFVQDLGWDLSYDRLRNRVESFTCILPFINTDWLFYHEEDAPISYLPNNYFMSRISRIRTRDNRQCGMISLMAGGSTYETQGPNNGDLVDDLDERVLLSHDDFVVLRRDESKRNEYFLTFPAMFIRTELLRKCHHHAKVNYPGAQIEVGISRAWFDLGLDREYFVASVLRPNYREIILADKTRVNDGIFVSFLDPDQGMSPLGGRHVY